ncbi:MAG TPA: DUF3891 family protein [Terriglobales bacterium]
MVLRPILDYSAGTSAKDAVSAWKAVEAAQHVDASEYWLVPQPAHAALSGDIAAALRPELYGPIDATIARCIALHDAGWSSADAAVISELRAGASTLSRCPASFVDANPEQAADAWTASIETAQKFAPIGGYIVSSHFVRLAEHAGHNSKRVVFDRFVARERARQERLLPAADRPKDQLDRLVDALQFCDLFSLYLCCGSQQRARFQCGAVKMQVAVDEGGHHLDPSPFIGPQQFNFPALHCSIAAAPKARAKAAGAASRKNENAVFYINV